MRRAIWKAARWLLFQFDAESAHLLTVRLLRFVGRLGPAPLRLIVGGGSKAEPVSAGTARVLGMEFRSRLGLAAGFDKNAELVTLLPALGFGFVEIGTVTPRPQPGNPRPRLFRDATRLALFNRMGFNGIGATLVAQRLAQARPGLPEGFRVGVNLGKNKDTPLEGASVDYVRAAQPFEDLADYLVINVSSPNTPGLRDLQSAQALQAIVSELQALISGWKRRPPLLLKLAPELFGQSLQDLLGSVEAWGAIDGWVLTNTLAGTRGADPVGGGWSGAPLKEHSRRSLVDARKVTRLPIISVGGIDSAEEALARVELGAELVQIYSGWVFAGPALPERISGALKSKSPGPKPRAL